MGQTNDPAAHPRPASVTRLIIAVCTAFFAAGMAQVVIGPALPDLAYQTGSTTVAAGGALAALFIGALAGYTIAGALLGRVDGRRSYYPA